MTITALIAKLAIVVAAVVAAHNPNVVAPQVKCYPTLTAYWQDTRIEPVVAVDGRPAYWPGGVAGAFGWLNSDTDSPSIALTPQECADLAAFAATGAYTWQRGYSVWLLGHEVGHVLYGTDERTADCAGLALMPAVAYQLGLRSPRAFAEMQRDVPRLTGTRGCQAARSDVAAFLNGGGA